MKKFLIFILIATGSLALTSCATTQYMQAPNLSQQKSAKVIIKRPSAFFGSGIRAPIYVNNNYIGRIGNGGELNWTVPAGPVTVATSNGSLTLKFQNQGSSFVRFNAQNGRTYVINVEVPYQMNLSAPFIGEAAFDLKLVS